MCGRGSTHVRLMWRSENNVRGSTLKSLPSLFEMASNWPGVSYKAQVSCPVGWKSPFSLGSHFTALGLEVGHVT